MKSLGTFKDPLHLLVVFEAMKDFTGPPPLGDMEVLGSHKQCEVRIRKDRDSGVAIIRT